MTPVVITFPFPPRELHPNARVHWAAKQRIVREYRWSCCVMGMEARGYDRDAFPLPTPVTAQATFVVTNRHKRDEDGLAASIKALWDGLCDAKVLKADDSASLHLLPVAVVVDKSAAPCVRVALESGA